MFSLFFILFKGLLFKKIKQTFVLTIELTYKHLLYVSPVSMWGICFQKRSPDVSVKKRIRIDGLDDFHSACLKLMNKLFELILNYFILINNEFVAFTRHFSRIISHRI